MTTDRAERQHETEYETMTYTCNKLIIKCNKLTIMFCGGYGLWPIWIFRVVDMVFGCGRYRLAVADMVCGQYGSTPLICVSVHAPCVSTTQEDRKDVGIVAESWSPN